MLHRTEKNGLGKAYIAGFQWGLERGYDVLVEMDADGSHAPENLPRILAATSVGDLVIGSRYVAGGHVVNWPMRRMVLSKAANLYARLALGVGLHDITAGYRAYKAEVLRALPLDDHRVARLLLPGRPGVAHGAGGLHRHRGADHVHRAGHRRVQDERQHHPRGAVQDHLLGFEAAVRAGRRSASRSPAATRSSAPAS